MPSFGLLTNPSIEILREIRDIHALGLDYVEIGIESPEGSADILQRKCAKIMKLLRGFKVRAIGHTSPWIDLGSDYEYVREGWIAESKRILDTSHKLGLELVNFHANTNGMFVGRKRKILLDNWVRSLREIVSYASELNIEVMLENMPKGGSVHALDEYGHIVRNLPKLKVHLDVAHAFTSGGMTALLEYITTFKERIVHVHWHDNKGEFDEHLPIGEGVIDHRRVVNAFKNINYSRSITLEVFTSKNDALLSSKKLKQLWQE